MVGVSKIRELVFDRTSDAGSCGELKFDLHIDTVLLQSGVLTKPSYPSLGSKKRRQYEANI